jgi:hypothetical protein
MANIASEISKVRGKATSYKTAYLKAEDSRTAFTYYVLGYSKNSGICTVLVQSPYCPNGEFGTAYYREIAGLPVDPTFVEQPSEAVRRSLR